MHGCFKPYASIVCNGDWGIGEFSVIGHPWCSHFGSWDFLSTNIVESICRMFHRDAIPALCFNMEGASENIQLCYCWEDDSECHMSPVWGCRHGSGKLVLLFFSHNLAHT